MAGENGAAPANIAVDGERVIGFAAAEKNGGPSGLPSGAMRQEKERPERGKGVTASVASLALRQRKKMADRQANYW